MVDRPWLNVIQLDKVKSADSKFSCQCREYTCKMYMASVNRQLNVRTKSSDARQEATRKVLRAWIRFNDCERPAN